MTGAEVAEYLVVFTVEKRTGAVEWRDDRRRRLFFFDKGELVLLQSNLKSESPQRIAELHPGLDGASLRDRVNELRLRGALEEVDGVVAVHADVPAPERSAIETMALFWRVADALPRPSGEAFPRFHAGRQALLDRLPAPPAIRAMIRELEGDRSFEDIVAFSAGEPAIVENALALAALLGVVEVGASESGGALILPSGSNTRPTPRPAHAATIPRPPGVGVVAAQRPVTQPKPTAPQRPVTQPKPTAPVLPASLVAPSLSMSLPSTPAAPSAIPLLAPGATLNAAPTHADAEPTSLDELALLIQQSQSMVEEAPGGGDAVLVDAPTSILVGTSAEGEHEVVLAPKRPSPEGTLGPALKRIRGAKTHFEVFGADWQAPPEVLRKEYLQLARDLHPDRWASAEPEDRRLVETTFERVREAWDVLGNEESRVAYTNRVIHGVKSEEEVAQERVKVIMEAESEFKRGLAEFNNGRMLQANELFTRAYAKVPEDQEMRAFAGFTTFRVHAGRQDEKAEAGAREVAEAIRANERLDQGHVLWGLIRWAKGDTAGAKAAFVQALRIRPANPDALRELKRLQREMEGDRPGGDAGREKDAPAGFFARLFAKKK